MQRVIKCFAAVTAVAVVLSAVPAQAGAILSPTTVLNVVPEFFPGCCAIERTIDQSGLSAGFTSGVTDFDTYIGTSPSHVINFNLEWFAPGGTFTQNIDYDLGALYSVFRMAFWNEESWGTSSVSVFSATDATFGATTLLGTFGPTNWPVGPYFADVFDTADAVTRYIRLSVVGTPGNDGDGSNNESVSIGEVAFDVGPAVVPEPATLALFGIGAATVALRRRRKA